jgi:cellulose synthase (UDP-forming)
MAISNKKEISRVSTFERLLFFGSFFLLLLLFLYLAAITLTIRNQLILSVGVLFFLFCIRCSQNFLGDYGRIALVLLSAYLSLRYWFFRTEMTLSYTGLRDFIFLILLYLAETYGIFTHLMGMMVNISPLQRECAPLPDDPRQLPTVDVFIPTYNEPPETIRLTATACTQLIYPKEKLTIFILDDGGTDQKINNPDPEKAAAAKKRAQKLKAIARRLGIRYVTRESNIHAKAGNINAALMNQPGERNHQSETITKTGAPLSCGELILILDCDHVPSMDFLQNTVGFFLNDDKLAFVQTPHFFINPTPVEKNLDTHRRSPTENEMFYGGVHLGLDFWNSSFFCGSAAVLRRKHLLEIGGLSCDTITEDAATAMKLHRHGFKSIYLNKPMTVGLSPESFDGFIIQRSRWAKGMTQILLLKNPLLQKGLSITQRLCYFNACLYWLFGLARIIFFLSPLMFLFFGLRVYNASLLQVLGYTVPHLIASYFVSNSLYGKLRHPFFSDLFETIQSIFLAPAVLSVFFRPRAPEFKVTPKTISLEKDRLTHLASPFYAMLVAATLAFPVAAWRYFANPELIDTIIICVIWNTFNFMLVLCCLGVVWESKQLRKAHRYTTKKKAALVDSAGNTSVAAAIADLSASGLSLVAKMEGDLVGKKLFIDAADGYGNAYCLPIFIVRTSPHPSGRLLGCRFEITSEKIYRQVIRFVFGDSQRLKYYHQTRSDRPHNTFVGIFNLIGIGLRGTLRNMHGLAIVSIRNSRILEIPSVLRAKGLRRTSAS